MQEVYDFLKKCDAFFLATDDDGQPRVRPFGALTIFDERLCLQTGKVKDVSKQLTKNPKLEICAFDGQYWLRVQAVAVEDDRREARAATLEAYPNLRSLYNEDDGNTQVWYLKDVIATFKTFTGEPRVVKF